MDKLKTILLATIYLMSLFMAAISFILLIFLTFPKDGINIPGVIIFSFCTLIFWYASLSIKKKKEALYNNLIENIIIGIATPHDGLITSSELAGNSSLSLKAAANYLESCYLKGVCDKKFTEDNLVEVYFFKSALTLSSKSKSKLISDIKI